MNIKTLLSCAVILLCASAALSQSNSQPSAQSASQYQCKDEVSYDRFKDITTVICGLVKTSVGLDVNLIAEYKGEKLTQPAHLSFHLGYWDKEPTRYTKAKYKDADVLYITDSARLEMPVRNYKFQSTAIIILEDADVDIDGDNLIKLTEAKSIEARWGKTEFKFSEESLGRLHDFLKRYNTSLSQ